MATNYTYDYFISYRRACGGALAARYVKSILQKYGKTAFLDVDDLKKGEYEPQIFNAIENSKDFILILNEDSWREKVKIDVYYEEIIRITKQDGDIIPIEFAKDVLKNIPGILSLKILKNIGAFEKISYNHEDYFQFEEKLCDKLDLPYSPDSKIKQLPHFSMPFEFEEGELVKRDKKVREICDEIVNHRIYNLVGIGGCGKTTLTYLLADQYKNLFDNIAYVVVNGNIKEDFVAQINATLKFDFEQNIPIDDKYNALISFMDQYQTGNNLLILDVNETADKKAIEDYAKKLKNNTLPTNKIYPNGWNILILSREKFGDFPNEDLSDDVDKEFLKELFLKRANKNENDFEDYDGLFELIKYSPLLAEQLGIYFEYQPIPSLEEIKGIFYGDLLEEEIQGTNAHNREERTLIGSLKNLVDYQKLNGDEKTVLRHFVLWESEYIGYDIVKDLLQGVCAKEKIAFALRSLLDKNILSINSEYAYKLHGLLNSSLRQQIIIENEDWSKYLSNIERVIGYDDEKFESFIDCIGNSLKMINFMNLSNKIAYRFYCLYKQRKNKKLQSYINKEPIYISYAHNNPNKEGQEHIADVVDSLIELFINNGIQYRVDEKLEGGDSITEFERAIGDSMYLIIVYNKKYFESPHCMYEFKQIINSNVAKKIIYINSDNININDYDTRLKLFRVWGNFEEDVEFKNPDTLGKIALAAMDNKYYKNEIKKLPQIINDINHYKTNDLHTLSDVNWTKLINSVKKWFLNT